MKKLFSIVILCGILFSACKKENEDYRDQVLGTYSGIMINHYLNTNDTSEHQSTITVEKTDTVVDKLIFRGNLNGYSYYDFILNSDNTLDRVYSVGYFKNDSLVFDLRRNYILAKFYLKKN